MRKIVPVITGIGVVAPNGIGKDIFWENLEKGKNAICRITEFSPGRLRIKLGAQIKNFKAEVMLGPKGLRHVDKSALFLMSASKLAIEDAKIVITEKNTDSIGVCTGTTFSHLVPILEFDREVFKEGINAANPALFPPTVLNAASSMVSIRFNIQGLNATISTGYTSSLAALEYGLNAIENNQVKTVLAGGVDTLNFPVLFGYNKLKYIAGIKGIPVCCPYDKRRNGPLLGEGAGTICVEDFKQAKKRGARIYAKIKSVSSYFDARGIAKIHPQGLGLEKAIRNALDEAKILPGEIDYISSCANSSQDMDKIEVKVLKKIFGRRLKKIPVSSIKSMLGENVSASGMFQIISCIGAMRRGKVPPTINYKIKDPDCDINCVPNKARKRKVKTALVTSFGPGGYNGACILEKV